MLALAQSGPAEIESQYRNAKCIHGLHGVKHDFVVERPAIKRMRMTD
jgi:hypothetical protein